MISKAVTQYAQQHGFKFFVNGLGYRSQVEITDLNNKHITWTPNTSKGARNTINDLINQKRLAAKSDEAIATEAEQAISDLLPPVVAICDVEADQAYQELLPVVDHERIAKQGELTADDFRSTYTPRDTFGDDAFVFSARYGEMALI